MDKKEIAETITAANLYLKRLTKLSNDITSAEEQIKTTSREAEQEIEVIFTNIANNLARILTKRRETLVKKVQNIKIDSLKPLQECGSLLANKIETTNNFIKTGLDLLEKNEYRRNNVRVVEFSNTASSLGSLPEIPELKEVPFISFQHEPSTITELTELCTDFGSISRIAPIQISQIIEKPGAVLVEWHSIEVDERLTDIQAFRLQRAYGNVTENKHLSVNFHDCFQGLDAQFLVKDLQPNQPYSFRVCCKFEGSTEWSPWSLPQIATTSIEPFSWRDNNDYALSNENKIAAPVRDLPSTLLSDGPQFCVGYSVEFTFLDVGPLEAVVGLIKSNNIRSGDLKSLDCCFVVDSCGEIFIDGVKKATKLPDFCKGLKVCFTCELVNDDKVRVNIDSCDKRVTYDWQISKNDELYFAASFKSMRYKIMVE